MRQEVIKRCIIADVYDDSNAFHKPFYCGNKYGSEWGYSLNDAKKFNTKQDALDVLKGESIMKRVRCAFDCKVLEVEIITTIM